MFRVRTVWTGVVGSPWYNNLFFNPGNEGQASSCHAAVVNFWNDLAPLIGAGITAQIQPEVYEINPASGEILDVVDVGVVNSVGTGTGQILPPANQGLISLRTGVYRNNRPVIGKVFIPGLIEGIVNQTIEPVHLATIQAAADELKASEGGGLLNGWSVWSRPRTILGVTLPGAVTGVGTVLAQSKVAILRSRRD